MGGDREKHRNKGQVALQTFGQAFALDSEAGLVPLQTEVSLASVNAHL